MCHPQFTHWHNYLLILFFSSTRHHRQWFPNSLNHFVNKRSLIVCYWIHVHIAIDEMRAHQSIYMKKQKERKNWHHQLKQFEAFPKRKMARKKSNQFSMILAFGVCQNLDLKCAHTGVVQRLCIQHNFFPHYFRLFVASHCQSDLIVKCLRFCVNLFFIVVFASLRQRWRCGVNYTLLIVTSSQWPDLCICWRKKILISMCVVVKMDDCGPKIAHSQVRASKHSPVATT